MGKGRKNRSRQRQTVKHITVTKTVVKPKRPVTRRFVVPLAVWNKFEEFQKVGSTMEATFKCLQDDWNAHLDFLAEQLSAFVDLTTLENFDYSLAKLALLLSGNGKVYRLPNRSEFQNMQAEVYVEELEELR